MPDEQPPKRKRGAQPKPGGRVRFTTTLPRTAIDKLSDLGDGNASAGILLLLEWFEGQARYRGKRVA